MSDVQRQDRPATSEARRYLSFVSGYWRGPGALRAWLLTGFVLLLVFTLTGAQVALNWWNRYFFDALEAKNVPNLWYGVMLLPAVVAASAIVTSALFAFRMLLQVRWREWTVKKLTGWWIADQRYYRLNLVAPEHSVPEYRIADDVRLSIEPLVEFALGLLTAFVTATAFAAILWRVGGEARFSLAGYQIVIPAYMAFAAVLYAVVASTAAYLVGKPFVQKVGEKNEAEAQFRASMGRLRENAESIALIKGDAEELQTVHDAYRVVVKKWVKIARHQGYMGLVLNTNGAIFAIVPLLLIAPKYVAGSLTLGAVMQVVAAFSAVQGALIWFVDNIVRIAEWLASARRVNELLEVLEDIDAVAGEGDAKEIELGVSTDDNIHFKNLQVADRGGRIMISDASVEIAPREKVLVTGPSGSGKSTLIRALAGLWPWGSGIITVPKGRSIAFVPQQPYMPLGKLRDVMCYPQENNAFDDTAIHEAMQRCGLKYLTKRLDEEDRWDRVLSGGERQRVAFARLLLQKPDIIVMDEATSALDEDSQDALLSLLNEELADSTVVSVGHRPGIENYHSRQLHLELKEIGARLSTKEKKSSTFKRALERVGLSPRPAES